MATHLFCDLVNIFLKSDECANLPKFQVLGILFANSHPHRFFENFAPELVTVFLLHWGEGGGRAGSRIENRESAEHSPGYDARARRGGVFVWRTLLAASMVDGV